MGRSRRALQHHDLREPIEPCGMVLTPDQEGWAEALAIEKLKGPDAPAFIAERIAALTVAGDAGGATRLRAIAWRAERLLEGSWA